MKFFELSEKTYKNGRRPFKSVLYELQPPECVVDEVGTKYNKNGITFLEEYAKQNLDSIKDMSVRVEFIDADRTMICGHGLTGSLDDDFPVFKNATLVGHFTNGYIADVEFEDGTKRCVCGEGYLDEMCYPDFVQALKEDLEEGIQVNGSIEIYKTKDNDSIVYKYGYKEKGRIPTEYIHSGWDMVIQPADQSSKLFELNSINRIKGEVTNKMDKEMLKEISDMIKDSLSGFTVKETELKQKITELNEVIKSKDAEISQKNTEISELNASIEDLKALKKELEEKQENYWREREILEEEIAKATIAQKLAELKKMTSEFNEKEIAVAKNDIKKLEDNINACKKKDELNSVSSEINSIKAKICMNIVASQKANDKKFEQNSLVIPDGIDGDMFDESMSGKLKPIVDDTDLSGIY